MGRDGPGNAVLRGTPAAGAGGTYTLHFNARNRVGTDASQSFILSVYDAPAITSAATATFSAGTAGSFAITATGFPKPSFTETGALPAGIIFTDNGDGSATLHGTPSSGAAGASTFSIGAHGFVGDASQTFTLRIMQTDAASAFLSALYHTVLNREPDAAGLAFWTTGMQSGATRQQIAQGFWQSPEHRGIQVDGFYATLLHRQAEPLGRAGWVNGLLGGMSETAVELLFLTSAEYTTQHASAASFVVSLYVDLFNRSVDAAGQGWVTLAQTPSGRVQAATGILLSPEMNRRIIDRFYLTLLHRSGDAGGESQWIALLQSQPAQQATIAELFLASPEFFQHSQGT